MPHTQSAEATANGFFHSDDSQPHLRRAQEILQKHPEVVKLIGRNPNTAAILVALFLFQMTVAALLGSIGFTSYWWLALIVAYGIGAFAVNPMYVIIHEATHNMIFKNRTLNKFCILLADVTTAIPGGIGFSNFHLHHHAYMGDEGLDADLPSEFEARWVQNVWWRKALWLFLFPIMQVFRSFTLTAKHNWNAWMYTDVLLVIAFNVAVGVLLGGNAIFYLFFSTLFSLGLHPLGARWIQEHFTLDDEQETFSYYGPINVLSLNVGYHVEHHDFPSIPWHQLPKLRQIAPEYYNNLRFHASWTRLFLDFIFNPQYSLYSRIKRERESIVATA